MVAPPFRRRYEESEPLQGGKATSRGFVDEDVQRPAIALGVYRQTIVGFGLGVRNRQNVGFYKGLVKQNADQTHRQQQRQHQRNTALPAEAAGILKSAPDVAEDPEVQGYVNDYRNSLGRLEDRSSQRGGVDPVRRVIDRQKNKLKKELISKIRKSKIYQQGTKKLKKWIWRGIGPIGSIIEIEGLLCWTEFIFGLLVNGFQTLKSVVLPVVTEARPGDPNSGQIIKGVLSFAGGNQDFSEYAYEQMKQETLENKIALDKFEIAVENEKENMMTLRTQEQVQSEKVSFLQNNLHEASKELSQFKQELSMHSLSKEEDSGMMTEFSQQKETLISQINVVENRLSAVSKKIETLNEEEEQKRQRIFALQDSMQEEQMSLNKHAEEKHSLQVEIVKLQTHREDLEQEIFSELQEGIGNIVNRLIEKFVEDEMETAKIEIEKLKYQLSLIGGIDESVMSEYEEIRERHDSLAFELVDLNKASSDLEKMIEELDKLMKKKHKESFNKIKKEFARYFKLLFEGGSAELVEVYGTEKDEDEMVLEGDEMETTEESELENTEKKKKRKILTGVEVYACPPGKKIKNISALSGGERTMTSIALLCAILHTNPSPFVILDEVEAALDEANTTRFTKILGELSMQSQFIIITHNRVTMHAVDVLYGVTMGNDGISKLLSVKLDN